MTFNLKQFVNPAAPRDLMSRVRAGDVSAFQELVQPFHRPVIAFFYRLLNDAARAEDLAADTFIKMYRGRHSYRNNELATWIYSSALDVLRQSKGLENFSLQAEITNAVAKLVRRLNEQERIALLLHKYQGLDISQIAEVLNTREDSAKALLQTAYQQLTRQLQNCPAAGQGRDTR